MARLGIRPGPLAEREFGLLFAGRTISLFGSAFAPIALAFAVLDLTGSPTDLGIVVAAGFVPQILFVLVGGIWADRLPRHHVMVASDAVAGAAQALIAALVLTGAAELWHLIALQVVRGAATVTATALVLLIDDVRNLRRREAEAEAPTPGASAGESSGAAPSPG